MTAPLKIDMRCLRIRHSHAKGCIVSGFGPIRILKHDDCIHYYDGDGNILRVHSILFPDGSIWDYSLYRQDYARPWRKRAS